MLRAAAHEASGFFVLSNLYIISFRPFSHPFV